MKFGGDVLHLTIQNLVPGLLLAVIAIPAANARAQDELAKQLRDLDTAVIVRGKVRVPPLASMLGRDVEARLREVNRADIETWQRVKARAEWEALKDARIRALRASLGTWPSVPKDLKVRVTGSHAGDGYRIDNLVYETRPGLVVTANLYRPAKPTATMAAIVIVHSHNSSKHTTSRQDMGMTWARAGCLVLIPDHLGHGERRQHPFGAEGPHDYHGRYDAGIQLHLIGEGLMGWFVWDLMRGVDVLLAQPGTDPKRVVLISEPAGGGDVAAVTAALDPRIAGVLVNNFGGPEPENAYPLPRDAEHSFDFVTSGSWESTRNLRLSARDGFLPWLIDAAVAPRRLIYYHEFYWDHEQDPVWRRLERVYKLYGADDALAALAGRGFVVGSPPDNTHWIAINREITYPVLERWFAIPNPKKEYSKRRPDDELLCLNAETAKELTPLHVLAQRLATDRLAEARRERAKLTAAERRERMRQDWTRLLGDLAPKADPTVQGLPQESQQVGTVTFERIHLRTEPGIVVPVILLTPAIKSGKAPVVVCLAQAGKAEFLKRRAEAIAELLNAGVAVCLPDLRGTGETDPGGSRGRGGPASNIAASEWMLGQSLLGGRLRDLRSVLRHLRLHPKLDAKHIGLWGESFAEVNAAERDLRVPHNAAKRPPQAEPLGGLLALLGGLFEDDVRVIYAHGALSDYASALEMPVTYLPADAVVPGVLSLGDLGDLAGVLAPRPLWLDAPVDGVNRAVSKNELAKRYAPARTAYDAARAPHLYLGDQPANASPAAWLAKHLRSREP